MNFFIGKVKLLRRLARPRPIRRRSEHLCTLLTQIIKSDLICEIRNTCCRYDGELNISHSRLQAWCMYPRSLTDGHVDPEGIVTKVFLITDRDKLVARHLYWVTWFRADPYRWRYRTNALNILHKHHAWIVVYQEQPHPLWGDFLDVWRATPGTGTRDVHWVWAAARPSLTGCSFVKRTYWIT